jgi:hypothetical protein
MRRPLSIRLLTVLFFIAPLAILVFNAMINMVPLYGPGNVWFRLSTPDRLILLLYPLTALAMYQVRPWGWWFIIGSAAVLVGYNVVVFLRSYFISPALMAGMNLVLFLFAGLFFRKHIIAPYFNPQLRWWEQQKCYDDSTYAKVINDGSIMIIDNISRGGCFLIATSELSGLRNLFLEIVHGRFHIRLMADVVRQERHSQEVIGYGMMFTRISEQEAAGLEEFLSTLRKISDDTPDIETDEEMLHEGHRHNPRFETGYHLKLVCHAVAQGSVTAAMAAAEDGAPALEGGHPAGFIDISRSGCSILATGGPEVGTSCALGMSFHHDREDVPVRVIWKKPVRSMWKFGLRFDNPDRHHRKIIATVIREARITGAVPEQRDRSGWDLKAEEALSNTPIGRLRRRS